MGGATKWMNDQINRTNLFEILEEFDANSKNS